MLDFGNRILDTLDLWTCKVGLRSAAQWTPVRSGAITKLYAGRLSRGSPQFSTHLGQTPFAPSSRNIAHDVTTPLPLADGTINIYQACDVFEHIRYAQLPFVFDEIYRVLKPGGLFRLSVPDYRCDVYRARSKKDERGNIVFDPGGGGRFEGGKVIDGGHVWFPVYKLVKALFDDSSFADGGRVDYLHYTRDDGKFVLRRIDYSLGHIERTPDHDDRVMAPDRPLSIVVDAYKAE